MTPIEFSILFFGLMFFSLGIGVPIFIALGGVSAILVAIFWSPGALSMMVLTAYSTTSSFEYLAIPLFIFMANMLERSGVAEDLYTSMNRFMSGVPGGLAAGTVGICAIFAAMAGVSGAATVSMGIIALPAMLSRGYPKGLALGSIAAGGSLGILIPPSVTMIVYGLVSNTSIGRLYVAGYLPGLLLALLFVVYCLLAHKVRPAIQNTATVERFSWTERLLSLRALIIPVLIIVAVLGAMLSGLTSVSEAAAVGALSSIVATLVRKGFRWSLFREAADRTLLLTCLIFWIIIAASAFSTLYTAMGAAEIIKGLVLGHDLNRYVVLLIMMAVLVVLGMVIDTVGIIMITVPIFVPIIVALGFDPVWFGILFIITMEIGFLTPPFGYNLFYLRGVAPDGVSMGDIYGSVYPFVVLMLVGLGICIAFPQIVLVLPNLIF